MTKVFHTVPSGQLIEIKNSRKRKKLQKINQNFNIPRSIPIQQQGLCQKRKPNIELNSQFNLLI